MQDNVKDGVQEFKNVKYTLPMFVDLVWTLSAGTLSRVCMSPLASVISQSRLSGLVTHSPNVSDMFIDNFVSWV